MKNNMLNDQELENVVGGITQNDAMAARRTMLWQLYSNMQESPTAQQ